MIEFEKSLSKSLYLCVDDCASLSADAFCILRESFSINKASISAFNDCISLSNSAIFAFASAKSANACSYNLLKSSYTGLGTTSGFGFFGFPINSSTSTSTDFINCSSSYFGFSILPTCSPSLSPRI